MSSDFPIKPSNSNMPPFQGGVDANPLDVEVKQLVLRSLANRTAEQQQIPRKIVQANVVILAGTSSVGKTSIIQEIKRQSQEKEWIEFDSDLVGPRNFEAFWDQEHENLGVSESEYKIFKDVLKPLENNMHLHFAIGEPAYLDKDSVFINSATPEQKETAKKVANKLREPTEELAEKFSKDQFDIATREILYNAESGKSTIIGVLDESKLFKDYSKPTAQITTALVYCSFQNLSNRLSVRNKEAIESGKFQDIRGTHPLFDFAKLFRPKTEQDDPKAVLEELSRETVVDVFNFHFDAMKKEILRSGNKDGFSQEEEHDLEEKREFDKNRLLSELGFTDPSIDKVQLVPRKKYDVLIDTNASKNEGNINISRVQSIKNAAEAILKMIKQS